MSSPNPLNPRPSFPPATPGYPAAPSHFGPQVRPPSARPPLMPPPQHAVQPVPMPAHDGPDGNAISRGLEDHLDYLSRTARELGVPDPVEEYFGPVVGQWNDMHAEAERWRTAARTLEDVSARLTKPLGGLDAAWDGADSDAFMEYMQGVGLAGAGVSDAMEAMGEALDTTAEGLRQIVRDLVEVLADDAETVSEAMVVPVAGEERARHYLDQQQRPTKELFEAAREVLEALVKLCDGFDSGNAFGNVKLSHKFPEQNWSFDAPKEMVFDPKPAAQDPVDPQGSKPSTPEPPKGAGGGGGGAGGGAGGGGGGGAGGFGGGGGGGGSVGGAGAVEAPKQPLAPGGGSMAVDSQGYDPARPAAAAAAGPGAGGGAGGAPAGGGPMGMPMGGAGGGTGGQDEERKSKSRLVSDPADIFGKPTKTAPPVIGDDD